jgi:hypothetical protein
LVAAPSVATTRDRSYRFGLPGTRRTATTPSRSNPASASSTAVRPKLQSFDNVGTDGHGSGEASLQLVDDRE